ncbi:sortase B protein-sorting domain-containing protein [Thalassobacillus sp. CUG 92003]
MTSIVHIFLYASLLLVSSAYLSCR